MKYKIGDTLIQTKHGTDFSYDVEYIITGIGHLYIDLERKDKSWAWIETSKLDERLKGEYPNLRIVSKIFEVKLDEELFEL